MFDVRSNDLKTTKKKRVTYTEHGTLFQFQGHRKAWDVLVHGYWVRPGFTCRSLQSASFPMDPVQRMIQLPVKES